MKRDGQNEDSVKTFVAVPGQLYDGRHGFGDVFIYQVLGGLASLMTSIVHSPYPIRLLCMHPAVDLYTRKCILGDAFFIPFGSEFGSGILRI